MGEGKGEHPLGQRIGCGCERRAWGAVDPLIEELLPVGARVAAFTGVVNEEGRKLLPPSTTAQASKSVVFPAPLGPTMKVRSAK